MAGDDGASANIESLNAALAEAEIKAAAGDEMYLVRAKFLRSKLASLTTPKPEPAALPQAIRMAALNTAHTEAKAKSEEKSTQKNLEGSTQVTVVLNKTFNTTEPLNILFNDLAGASPHAPDRPTRQRRKKPTSKTAFIGFRIEAEKKAKLDAKAAAVELDLSSYFLRLADADLGQPIDEAALQRTRMLGDELAAMTLELTRQGTNFNQMTKAAHEGKPCALAQPQISELLRQNTMAVNAILRLGFD